MNKIRLSAFYSKLYAVIMSVSAGLGIACFLLAFLISSLRIMWFILAAMLFVTFICILLDCKNTGASCFHRSQLCKGGVCEFSANGEKKVKAIAWKNVRFVTVVNDYMTSQKWICFSKRRLSSKESSSPLRFNSKTTDFVLYPYSEKAYDLAVAEVNKHKCTEE